MWRQRHWTALSHGQRGEYWNMAEEISHPLWASPGVYLLYVLYPKASPSCLTAQLESLGVSTHLLEELL